MSARTAVIARNTLETAIELQLSLDGEGRAEIATGIGFLDHMLISLTKHARFDLTLKCTGDLEVDDHHTAEDCALALGQALDQALGERRGIARFGSAYAPLDEALARTVVDFSGRGFLHCELPADLEQVGSRCDPSLQVRAAPELAPIRAVQPYLVPDRRSGEHLLANEVDRRLAHVGLP